MLSRIAAGGYNRVALGQHGPGDVHTQASACAGYQPHPFLRHVVFLVRMVPPRRPVAQKRSVLAYAFRQARTVTGPPNGPRVSGERWGDEPKPTNESAARAD